MPVKRPEEPAGFAQGCCWEGVGALLGTSNASAAAAQRNGERPPPRVLPSAEGFEEGSAIPESRARIEACVLDEIRALQEQMGKELAGAIDRISKADSSEKRRDAGEDRVCLPQGFQANRKQMVPRAADDDVVECSPQARRQIWRRRFTAAADGKDSLLEILKNNAFLDNHTPEAQMTAENSSNDEESSKGGDSFPVSAFRSEASEAPTIVRRTSREDSRKNLHARIEERLNEVHQHHVEVPDSDEEKNVDEAKSDVSTPSCSSTTWRVDALDLGDRLAADAAAKKGSASVESIVFLVQSERERWATEKQGLEARLEELKEKLRDFETPHDAEFAALRKRVAELRQAIKARSRFGAWVCERHMQESDDEEDEDGEQRNADKEALRIELQQVDIQLRAARRKAGIVVISPTGPPVYNSEDGGPGSVASAEDCLGPFLIGRPKASAPGAASSSSSAA